MESNSLRIAIIDDEDYARDVIRKFIQKDFPSIHIAGEADSVQSARKLLQSIDVNLVFLDVKMQDGSAFDLLEHFKTPRFEVIFVTAFDSFAYRAFQFNAIDYLLKPIDPDQLIKAVEKYQKHFQENQFSNKLDNLMNTIQSQQFERIALSSSEGLVFLRLEQISRLESDGNYTTFHTTSGEKILVSKTIKEYESLLPEDVFFRVHQSHIVNTNHIAKILREDGGAAKMEDGTLVPVSRRRKDALVRLLTQKSL